MGVFFKSIIFVVCYPFWMVLSIIAFIAGIVGATLEWCNDSWEPWVHVMTSEEKELREQQEELREQQRRLKELC